MFVSLVIVTAVNAVAKRLKIRDIVASAL